jgi:hypothetical protein
MNAASAMLVSLNVAEVQVKNSAIAGKIRIIPICLPSVIRKKKKTVRYPI